MTTANDTVTRIFTDTEHGRDESHAYTSRMESQGYRMTKCVRMSQRNRWDQPTRWKLTMALTARPDNG